MYQNVYNFAEKHTVGPGPVNAGCYFLRLDVLREFPATDALSLEREVLLVRTRECRLAASSDTDATIDIGVPWNYNRTQSWFIH